MKEIIMLLLRTSKQFREVRKILHRCVDTIANKIHLFYIVPPPCFLLISPLYLFLFSVKYLLDIFDIVIENFYLTLK